MSTALALEGVSKIYRGAGGRSALRDDVVGGLKRVIGRREPPAVVRALDDVTFEITEGESVALIGPNGAGKTTALKLVTRISYPTSGTVRVRGRVGALIEVGTGMHPELTGRENIHLYGRMLGLGGRDIKSRFGQIVDFADIGAAVDRPVKQYSSGMQLRLGFAVAAHLEPDIFIVDEAIAVGDAGFQHRCVERMADLVREGRTLVLVSHDMNAVESLCQRALLVDRGHITMDDAAPAVVRRYLNEMTQPGSDLGPLAVSSSPDLVIERVELTGLPLAAGDELRVAVHYSARTRIESPILSIGIGESRHRMLILASNLIDGERPAALEGRGHFSCRFPALPLLPRIYEVWMSVRGSQGYGDLVDWQQIASFEIEDPEGARAGAVLATHLAPIATAYEWSVTTGDLD